MSLTVSPIVGPGGEALPSAPVRQVERMRRTQALNAPSGVPYDAADMQGQHMALWQPMLWSPDGELNLYRDRIVSRVRDLVRNDGWASGGITRILDAAVGGAFRPIAKPDYRALALHTGNTAFDAVWAEEYSRAAGIAWRTWSDGPGNWCDAGRSMSGSQLMRLAFRHKLVDGDALALPLWLEGRQGPGRAHYATTLQIIDPDRLSNPMVQMDNLLIRGGVEIDSFGAANAYHVRKAHQNDWWAAASSFTWERITREDKFGRPRVVHDFDSDRGGTHRGGAGILAPVVQRLRMLTRYDTAELDAALINAIFSAYVESPFDPQLVQEALGDADGIGAYQESRADFHRTKNITLSGARIPQLFPGEGIKTVTAARPSSNFEGFEGAMLRNAASAMGLSYEQLTQDYSRSNYSSSRAAMVELWKTMSRRRVDFGHGFATPVYACVLEEAMDLDELPLPSGAPPFFEHRGAYGRARWIGPGRGWVDPVKEKQGAVMGLDAGLSTLEHEAAENVGMDWEEILDQRAIERRAFDDRGLPQPSWAAPPAQQAGDPDLMDEPRSGEKPQ